MTILEQKAYSHVDRIFGEIIDKYKTAPWNEFREALAQIYLAGITEALAGQWRSVEDELPEAEQDVFVAVRFGNGYTYGHAWLSTLSNGTLRWYSQNEYLHLDNICYWMPIPEPSKDESHV